MMEDKQLARGADRVNVERTIPNVGYTKTG